MLSMPTPAKERSCSAVASWWCRPSTRRSAGPCDRRQSPFTSSRAVEMMCTAESGSSTHSTGISLTRIPRRSAVMRSSVSKNQASSFTSGSNSRAHSRRSALNPHWKSLMRLR